jgi:hypothetical protein
VVILCELSTVLAVVWVFLAVLRRYSHHGVVVLQTDVVFFDSFLCAGKCWCLTVVREGLTAVSVFLLAVGFLVLVGVYSPQFQVRWCPLAKESCFLDSYGPITFASRSGVSVQGQISGSGWYLIWWARTEGCLYYCGIRRWTVIR